VTNAGATGCTLLATGKAGRGPSTPCIGKLMFDEILLMMAPVFLTSVELIWQKRLKQQRIHHQFQSPDWSTP
jgi:hypothetical protein